MELSRNFNSIELINFLKKDYANNLYFFSYINDQTLCVEPEADILVAKNNGHIVLAMLISPSHCCISTLDSNFIDEVITQLPPIESKHILGSQDQTLRLLDGVNGPVRKIEFNSFCKLNHQLLLYPKNYRSTSLTTAELPELVRFYQGNDMLVNCKTRLKSIVEFGTIYCVKDADKIVSCALTTTETDDIAMIGAVFTDESQRNKGFARDCSLNLCKRLQEKNKSVYLFHKADDIMLANMYLKIGFDKIGTWVVATKK